VDANTHAPAHFHICAPAAFRADAVAAAETADASVFWVSSEAARIWIVATSRTFFTASLAASAIC